MAYFQVPWAAKNGALQTFGVEAAIVAALFLLIVPALQLRGSSLRVSTLTELVSHMIDELTKYLSGSVFSVISLPLPFNVSTSHVCYDGVFLGRWVHRSIDTWLYYNYKTHNARCDSRKQSNECISGTRLENSTSEYIRIQPRQARNTANASRA